MASLKRRVVVAMSGGVDSSVAAALLVEAGYDVVGVAMRLWESADQPRGASADQRSPSGCCSLDDFLDARLVAERLGIPFYVMDFRDEFRRRVVGDFVAEYRSGRTPNPCVRCNQTVKFASFWDRARELGADLLATGHYARVREGAAGTELLRAVDPDKDQSYFLFSIAPDVLARTLFPVGESTKTDVRRQAAARGLPVADKPDSQEVCFAPRGLHSVFVASEPSSVALSPGEIVDGGGRVLGRHDGVHRFTIGQRRGLGTGGGGAPLYVTDIDPASGTVRVGPSASVVAGGLIAEHPSWIGRPPRAGDRVSVKIRSRFAPHEAEVESVAEDSFVLSAPGGLRAVTPGQAAVLYDGERVLGGGWIRGALSSAPRKELPSSDPPFEKGGQGGIF